MDILSPLYCYDHCSRFDEYSYASPEHTGFSVSAARSHVKPSMLTNNSAVAVREDSNCGKIFQRVWIVYAEADRRKDY
jgi:hypothetical protein